MHTLRWARRPACAAVLFRSLGSAEQEGSTITAPTIIEESPLVDEILAPHRDRLGESLYTGYRNHTLRMVNFMSCLVPPEPYRNERIAITAAFHDLPVCFDWDLRYVERAADMADEYLEANGHPEWRAEIRLMIENHHKVRPYRGPFSPLVEATRKADWIDVTFTGLRFGLPRGFVRTVAKRFPMDGFFGPQPALGKVLAYAVRHPRCPLPMFRW